MSSFNGSGTFNISGVGLPYVSGTVISSSVANQLNTDLAAGLSKCILNDGQQTILANIGWNNFNINNLSALGIGTPTPSGQLQVVNGSTTNFIIDSSGNVGIGTNSPIAKLDVRGAIYANFGSTGTAFITSDAVSTDLQISTVTNKTKLFNSGGAASLAFGTASTERMIIDSSGNVGIGTSSPIAKLQINGVAGTAVDLEISRSSSSTTIQSAPNITFSDGTTNNTTCIQNSQGALTFWNYGTGYWIERMRIDSSGNVGIGTSSPTDSAGFGRILDISGSSGIGAAVYLRPSGSTTNYLAFGQDTSGNSYIVNKANNAMLFYTNNTERMRIDSAGAVTLSASPSAGDNSTKVATTAFVQQTVGGAKLQPLTTSGSGTLTITLAPTTLDFRNTASAGGATSTVNLTSSINISLIGAATLGFVNGTAGRIAVLAINNAGTIELAVVNANGGVNLDENALINTSLVSGGTGASTIYSTTARSSVAYRVVGYINATNSSSSWTASYTSAGAAFPIAQAPLRMARAWVNFDGTSSGTIIPRANFNIGSVTKNATGDYTLNFSVAMADANYAVSMSNTDVASAYEGLKILSPTNSSTAPFTMTTTALRIGMGFDVKVGTVIIFGN